MNLVIEVLVVKPQALDQSKRAKVKPFYYLSVRSRYILKGTLIVFLPNSPHQA